MAVPSPRPAGGRGPRRRRQAVALAVAVLAVVLGGCSIVHAVLTTDRALQDDGFTGVSANVQDVDSVQTVAVTVAWDGTRFGDVAREATQVARVVWHNTPGRFDELQVTVSAAPATAGTAEETFSHDQLAGQFGARPDGLDDHPVFDTGGLVAAGAIVLGVILAVIVGVIALAVVLTRRRRRRRMQGPTAGTPWGGYPVYATGAPGWGQPYGQPPGQPYGQPFGQPFGPPGGAWAPGPSPSPAPSPSPSPSPAPSPSPSPWGAPGSQPPPAADPPPSWSPPPAGPAEPPAAGAAGRGSGGG